MGKPMTFVFHIENEYPEYWENVISIQTPLCYIVSLLKKYL